MTDKRTVPLIFVENSEGPMTTDIALDLFDFGEMSEGELDAIVLAMAGGGTLTVECEGYGGAKWDILIKRAE